MDKKKQQPLKSNPAQQQKTPQQKPAQSPMTNKNPNKKPGSY